MSVHPTGISEKHSSRTRDAELGVRNEEKDVCSGNFHASYGSSRSLLVFGVGWRLWKLLVLQDRRFFHKRYFEQAR
jgi:hypothetical protein